MKQRPTNAVAFAAANRTDAARSIEIARGDRYKNPDLRRVVTEAADFARRGRHAAHMHSKIPRELKTKRSVLLRRAAFRTKDSIAGDVKPKGAAICNRRPAALTEHFKPPLIKTASPSAAIFGISGMYCRNAG